MRCGKSLAVVTSGSQGRLSWPKGYGYQLKFADTAWTTHKTTCQFKPITARIITLFCIYSLFSHVVPHQVNCPLAQLQPQAHPWCSRGILSNSESLVLRSCLEGKIHRASLFEIVRHRLTSSRFDGFRVTHRRFQVRLLGRVFRYRAAIGFTDIGL